MVIKQISPSLDGNAIKKHVSKLTVATSMLVLAGCSTPDWVNPGTWFDGGDGDAKRPEQIAQPESEYPKLGDVPDEAGKTVSVQEARDIEEGLKADRENAQYTDEQLRADTSQQPVPRPPAPVAPVAPAAPASGPAATAAPSPSVNATPIPQPGQVPVSSAPGQPGVKLMPNGAPVTTQNQAYAQIAPGTGTTVISGAGVNNVFQRQLAASAATTTTLPANTQFQSYPVQPIGNSAVAVSPIVRDTYNTPVALGYGNAVNGNHGVAVAGRTGSAAGVKPDAVIYFETGSSRIGAGDRSKLAQIASLQKQTGAMLRVVGHASGRTRELPLERHLMVNLRMSQERSSAVVTSLINLGVDSSKIIVESVSDQAPVTRETMPSTEAQNRRTEIFLVK
ncbi:OmpA family protein [Sneathiella aquimaris]|uniref:OmpA family protein n=1 Tax=Sneathiella aquimaris TaxID=2599305 RepID=UPI00146F2C6D|nr:OmpA family protein [Sneathiella aquimaris]